MNYRYYNADIADGLLKQAAAMADGLIEVVEHQNETISKLEHELSILKAAGSNKVTLEPVVGSGTSDEWANKLAETLAAHDLIDASMVEKYAAVCKTDPDAAAKFAVRALQVSESPVEQGKGIKSASTGTPEDAMAAEQRMWLDYCNSLLP